ncbi:energy transducer TonB [Photorhabdus temperata]|uniref:TonB family protein n=1 Tax=Photorhabdus khanii NC19 TaxID=1004151 RepID=W3V5L1_9GAMM|nr:energy transducer TonB [Photorhabdus khanii]ETS30410.1 TonB family protein [Photorhabdus khanii NC19]OHV59118.1 energy transducer TonB [Photorhabdus temperata]
MLTLTNPIFQTSHFKKGLVFAIAAHLIWIVWVIYQPEEIPDELMPPPAVMMEFSLLTEATHQVQKQPIGIEQQISVASRQQESAVNEMKTPELIKNEQAQILVHKPKKQKKNPEEFKKTPPVKRQQAEEESEKSQSSAARVSSTATSANLTSRVAASYDSDSNVVVDADALWRAEVIGHLNRYKRYPEDAQRRNRTGRPTVRFTINKQGYVTNSDLVRRSGTHSLDREAKQVLARAQPLPIPPDSVLKGSEITIELPIDFNLTNRIF